MSLLRQVRKLSTAALPDKWYHLIKAPFDRQTFRLKSAEVIKQTYAVGSNNDSNIISSIIQRQAQENSTAKALVISKSNANKQIEEAFTFQEMSEHASNLSGWLKSDRLRMIHGNQVLVLLSPDRPNYSFLQLACLQSNLIFQTMKTTNLNEENLRKKLRADAIDCIICDFDHLDLVNKVTYCNLRPLIKVIMSENPVNGVSPFGWVLFNQGETFGDKSSSKIGPLKEERKTVFQHLYPHLFMAHELHARGPTRFVWIKDDKHQIALSSWLLGSTAFYQKTTNSEKELRKTLENFPIDTFCGSKNDFQLLNDNEDSMKNQLTQLIATERIDDEFLRGKWRSSTNLEIDDNLSNFPNDYFSHPSWLSRLDRADSTQ